MALGAFFRRNLEDSWEVDDQKLISGKDEPFQSLSDQMWQAIGVEAIFSTSPWNLAMI